MIGDNVTADVEEPLDRQNREFLVAAAPRGPHPPWDASKP